MLHYQAPVTQLAGQRITLSYTPATQADADLIVVAYRMIMAACETGAGASGANLHGLHRRAALEQLTAAPRAIAFHKHTQCHQALSQALKSGDLCIRYLDCDDPY